jgi:hypothetical protein
VSEDKQAENVPDWKLKPRKCPNAMEIGKGDGREAGPIL